MMGSNNLQANKKDISKSEVIPDQGFERNFSGGG